MQSRHQSIEQREVEGEEQRHGEAEVSFAEKPVENVMGISVTAVQRITTKFEQAHRQESIKILLPPGQSPQQDGNGDHVEHINGDHLPPEDKAGDLQPLPNLVHHGANEQVSGNVGKPMNGRKPKLFAQSTKKKHGISKHQKLYL